MDLDDITLRIEEILNNKDEIKRLEKEYKERKVAILLHKVEGWDYFSNELHYSYLFPYYPTTCDLKLTDSEESDRTLVWDFKNSSDFSSFYQPFRHRQALDILVPKIANELKSTFDDNLIDLTLVCIPASSKVDNKRRFQGFSERLTTETGMFNAFEHICITQDASPKHLGGSGTPSLEFDESYFQGKLVLLFDDIITSGRSMTIFKSKLESMGAIVIAGFALGKTAHTRS